MDFEIVTITIQPKFIKLANYEHTFTDIAKYWFIDCKWVGFGYSLIFMDIYGYSWIFMDIHRYLWIFMDIHGYSWIFMDIYGTTTGYLDIWIFMDIYGTTIGYLDIWIFVEKIWNISANSKKDITGVRYNSN